MPRHKEKSRERHKSAKHKSRKKSHGSSRHRSKRSPSSSSTSSSSSSSSQKSVKLLKTLEDRRLQEQLERKRMKEFVKSNETPEEKRARRLSEKRAKLLRRRERMGWDTEYQHYTNQDNPFGDSNLTSTFVWNKKLEKEGIRNVSQETIEVLSRNKQLENKLELEKVKKRRMERELERQAREDEIVLQQRMRETAQFQEWERQEDQFHLEQARLRSVIRIQDGRAKPIDLLAQYVSSSKLDDAIEMQMHEPYVLLNGLGAKDLEDLLEDIKVYVELEKGNNNDFWNDMTVIVQDELHKLHKLQSAEVAQSPMSSRREGIHLSVVKDVSDIFRGKNTAQLNELRARIESKLSGRNEGVDISYWESLLFQLKAHMARARLRDRHQENLRQKLMLLKSAPESTTEAEPSTSAQAAVKERYSSDDDAADEKPEDVEDSEDNKMLETCFRLYEEGNYSPKYLSQSDLGDAVVVLNPEEDMEALERLQLQFIESLNDDKLISQEELKMRCEARKGMLADEVEFSVETPLDTPMQLASDKYRPRKPRYFNRVHTGFEWNKYNQTHYDMDNPPPKIVQGYKFNIFYPDLIEKSTTPQYFLTQCKDNADFAVLRFHAGPPYEDIAFKIVNREWEFSYKRGFRCQFQNNIFQLWFHFKRYRYRR